MPTIPIQIGVEQYPEDVLGTLQAAADAVVIKAGDIARNLGNTKTMNVVLLGALVKAMNLNEIDWESLIKKNVKKGSEEINWNAFKAGYKI